MTGKISLHARLAPGAEPPGFDIEVEVIAAGMPDLEKAKIARQLAEHAMYVLGRVTPSAVLTLPEYADGGPVPVPMPTPGARLPRDARL